MNYVDIVICIPLLWGLYKGFTKGLIIETASIIALGAGVLGGMKFSDACAEKIKESFDWNSDYLPVVSFAVVFLAIVIAVFFIGKLLSKVAKSLALGGVDKILGAAIGALKHALIISIVIFMIDAIEHSYPGISFDAKKESVLYTPVGKIAPLLIPSLKEHDTTSPLLLK